MSPIPGSARKKNAKRGKNLASPAATWRRRFARKGRTWSVMAANLPNKRWLNRARQVAWVRRKMVRVDVMTIAECTPKLARAINRLPGLWVTSAKTNNGGNGNVIVTKTKPRYQGEFRAIYTAIGGSHVTLNMARVIVQKGRTELTVDAVHFPSRGGFPKSSATPEQRAKVARQVFGHKAVTRDRVVIGDINDSWRHIEDIAQDEDPRWQHIGGDGVEHGFAVVSGPLLGQRMVSYGDSSDHRRTALLRVGIFNRS